MKFIEGYQEIINRISSLVQSKQCSPDLMAAIINAEKSIPGDGEIIEVDDNYRMVQGRLGNKLNRIEAVIISSSMDDTQKRYIIALIEIMRLSAGLEMSKVDHETAIKIRQQFGV